MASPANSIITPQVPQNGACVCTTANTNYTDTPTNTQLLYTAHATNGSRVKRITALARATVTATELQLFRSTDGGATKKYCNSALMPAYTVAVTTRQAPAAFDYSDLNSLELEPGEQIYAAISVSNTGIVFHADGADF